MFTFAARVLKRGNCHRRGRPSSSVSFSSRSPAMHSAASSTICSFSALHTACITCVGVHKMPRLGCVDMPVREKPNGVTAPIHIHTPSLTRTYTPTHPHTPNGITATRAPTSCRTWHSSTPFESASKKVDLADDISTPHRSEIQHVRSSR